MNTPIQSKTRVIASTKSWIESEAVEQLTRAASLPGMKSAIGFPDLHPGKGSPVGAAFVTEGIIYPYLIGNDIGCGMSLWQTGLNRSKIKRDRWATKLTGLESPFEGDPAFWLDQESLTPGPWDGSLGTIGGGNHFAELQAIEEVMEPVAFQECALDEDSLFLLVHSGSRGLGESILRGHVDKYRDGGIDIGAEDAGKYLAAHDHAVIWARVNRALIAHRFLTLLGSDGQRVIDSPHNTITPVMHEEATLWIHRKGAAPSDRGLVIIPGSRGALSYLVMPTGEQAANAWSIAHGAGRKWSRSHSHGRIKDRFRHEELVQTSLGSRVICEDKALLYEEAPPVYKNIDVVIDDLVEAGLVCVIATLRPLITYKTRNQKD